MLPRMAESLGQEIFSHLLISSCFFGVCFRILFKFSVKLFMAVVAIISCAKTDHSLKRSFYHCCSLHPDISVVNSLIPAFPLFYQGVLNSVQTLETAYLEELETNCLSLC